ncbi:MAG: hypothetical protein MK052_03890 [Alphaproteobacteria bacterium]|nr:hypothetical protein [Alphaproteobacteria bacterium]
MTDSIRVQAQKLASKIYSYNNSDGSKISPSQVWADTFAHAYASALIQEKYGSIAADAAGWYQEIGEPASSSNRDQWNNDVGQQLQEWAENNNYSVDSTHFAKMVVDAYKNDIFWPKDDTNDPRNGNSPPPYSGPTYLNPPSEEPEQGIPDNPNLPFSPGGAFPSPPGGALGPLSGLFDDPPYCPLILDLDMSGNIELLSLENSSAFFDMDEDGFAELAEFR